MGEQLIGREWELNFLEEQYYKKECPLVLVYGKRRTGKTTLLRAFFGDKPAVYYCAGPGTGQDSQADFRTMAAYTFPDNPAFSEDGKLSWRHMLRAFEGASDRRPVVVIDEVQTLMAMDPSFLSELRMSWNPIKEHVMLVLCGSDVGTMRRTVLEPIQNLVSDKPALLYVNQIPFQEYPAFFQGQNLTPKQLVERYAITGGIPRYIELFQDAPDLYAAIDELILNPRGILYEEPYLSLDREITGNSTCFSILRHIGQGDNRVRRISAVSGIQTTSLSGPLKRLAEMERIQRIVPVTAEEEEPVKKSVYRLQDNFLAFWFRFVYPYRSFLEIGRQRYVSRQVRTRLAREHTAEVYREICRERVAWMNAEGQLPVRYSRLGRWWDARETIGIMALNIWNEQDILFGDCVFQDKPAGPEVLAKLQEKVQCVPWGSPDRREIYAIFSVSGFTPALQAMAKKREDLLLFQ